MRERACACVCVCVCVCERVCAQLGKTEDLLWRDERGRTFLRTGDMGEIVSPQPTAQARTRANRTRAPLQPIVSPTGGARSTRTRTRTFTMDGSLVLGVLGGGVHMVIMAILMIMSVIMIMY